MNNYDGPRVNEMDEFLNFLYKMSNTRLLEKNDVYNVLCFYNLKPSDKPKDPYGRNVIDGLDNEYLFPYWINRFQPKRNIIVFQDPNWSKFCQFKNNIPNSTERFIKLYIPIDGEHLYDGANILFDFLERNNICHRSKISDSVRADNVVIRLNRDDTETAQKIIDFINNNPYLRSGLNKTNPFLPNINGIGYMKEHGNSYNSDLSHYIKEYINQARTHGQANVSAKEFRDFLYYCKRNNIVYGKKPNTPFDESLISTFEIAYSGQNKNLNVSNQPKLTDEQKRGLLIDGLRATYKKYGLAQIKTALNDIINYNNYSLITNDGNKRYRQRIRENISSSEVSNIVDNIVKAKSKMKFFRLEDKISALCSDLFLDDLPFLLDEICNVTLSNRGEYQVQRALEEFIKNGNLNYFSRFKDGDTSINYRDKIKMFDRRTFQDTICTSLNNKGIDTGNIAYQDICRIYARALEQAQIKL